MSNFYVERKIERTYPSGYWPDDKKVIETPTDNWSVYLPHSCDEWCITNDQSAGVPHDKAVTMLEEFIADAQNALESLKNREEIKWF